MSESAKSNDDRLLVTLSVAELRELIRTEVATAKGGHENKHLFTTKEAATMLNVEQSWLASKARAGEIPHRMLGHYRRFSMDDINAIAKGSVTEPKVKKGKKKNLTAKVQINSP